MTEGRTASHPFDPTTSGVGDNHFVVHATNSNLSFFQNIGLYSPCFFPSSRPTPIYAYPDPRRVWRSSIWVLRTSYSGLTDPDAMEEHKKTKGVAIRIIDESIKVCDVKSLPGTPGNQPRVHIKHLGDGSDVQTMAVHSYIRLWDKDLCGHR